MHDGFRQVEQEDARHFEDMGLGLHLLPRMAELLGGTMTMESRIGEGTRFRLWPPHGEVLPANVQPPH
jgi:light-regulated signal transduction histidine kinase (bacteriophytochrome)